MIRAAKYFLFFLLCLAIALVLNLPARHLLPHINLPPGVILVGLHGSVVGGRLRELRLDRFPLSDMAYRFQPSCLPLLKVCYALEYENGSGSVGYDLLNGDTEVSDARAEYTVDEITPHLPPLLVRPDGRLELTIDELKIVGGQTAALNAQLVWHDLGIESEASPIDLGDYRLTIVGTGRSYALELDDIDASLDVDGEGDLSAGGQYAIEVKISSTEGIDPKIRNLLDLAARRITHDNYRIERKGRLPPRFSQLLFR